MEKISKELEQYDQRTINLLANAAVARLGKSESEAEAFAKDLMNKITSNPNTITEDLESIGARDWTAELAVIVADSVAAESPSGKG